MRTREYPGEELVSMDDLLDSWRAEIEERLALSLWRGSDCPPRLREAMAYSLLGGGKRLRPLLVLMACDACGGEIEAAIPAACAIEMVHTYSLIHDDLPAMDDDDQRRGQPTCHLRFDEATAILAGDGLLTLAFEVLAADVRPPSVALACCIDLARAAGVCGMVGGQMADLQQAGIRGQRSEVGGQEAGSFSRDPSGERSVAGQESGFRGRGSEVGDQESGGSRQGSEVRGRESTATVGGEADSTPHSPLTTHQSPLTPARSMLAELESMHRRKTGCLLCCALTMGARIAGADSPTLAQLKTYGESVGLAFQIIDDLLDVRGDSETMGKTVRKDRDAGKLTYPGLLGEAESRRRAERLIDTAIQAIAEFGERGQRLEAMAHYVISRDR
jgi:geranylgeranyl diphosphate synthase type II